MSWASQIHLSADPREHVRGHLRNGCKSTGSVTRFPRSPALQSREQDDAMEADRNYVRYGPSIETIASMARESQITNERCHHAVRAPHARSHGLLKGELVVLGDLPEPLRQGYSPGPAVIRWRWAPAVIRRSTRCRRPVTARRRCATATISPRSPWRRNWWRRATTGRVLPPQDAGSAACQDYMDGVLSFWPTRSLGAHRPRGSPMQAELKTYPKLSALRHRQNGVAQHEPCSLDEIPG
jgi:hypothetical protein